MKPSVSKARAEKATKPLKRGELAILNGDPKKIKQIVEFIDKDRAIMDKYYDITEQYQAGQLAVSKVKVALRKLIKTDENFLDPYLFLAQIEYDAENDDEYFRLIWDVYLKAVCMVANKHGEYPKSLPWGYLENRHIIRALCNFALLQWEQGHIRLSLEIYRKLLASNLNDNIGARYSILALLLGYNSDYEALFLPDIEPIHGLDAKKMDDWFTEYSAGFPKEFADFLENAKKYE